MSSSNIYSRNRTINYEKRINSILCENSLNKELITEMALSMSKIANDKTFYIENNLNYLIKNTIQTTISQIEKITDYKKKEFTNNDSEYRRIGLKLSLRDKDIIQDLLQDSIDYGCFYKICLKNNHDNKTRNICVRFCPILP